MSKNARPKRRTSEQLRAAVLDALGPEDQSATNIAAVANLAISAVTRHLKALENEGLAASTPAGRRMTWRRQPISVGFDPNAPTPRHARRMGHAKPEATAGELVCAVESTGLVSITTKKEKICLTAPQVARVISFLELTQQVWQPAAA